MILRHLLLLPVCLITSQVQAVQTPYEILERQYLIKFSDSDNQSFQSEAYQSEKSSSHTAHEELSSRRKRELLLHHLYPECSQSAEIQGMFQTDIWQDMQVFRKDGYAHLYDRLFPGTSLLGEVYGACQLVTGSTSSIKTLKERKEILRSLMAPHTATALVSSIDEINQYINPVVRLLDKKHPFFYFFHMPILLHDEGTWAESELLIGIELKNEKAMQELMLQNNIHGVTPQFRTLMYIMPVLGLLTSGWLFKLSTPSRNVNIHTDQSVLWKGLVITEKTGSYILPWSLFLSTLYKLKSLQQNHDDLKRVNREITSELLLLRPFFSALYNLGKNTGLFNFTDKEESLLRILMEQMKLLTLEDYGYFSSSSIQHAASAMRIVVLLHGSINRWLKKLSWIDFMLSVSRQINSEQNPYTFVEFDESNSRRPYLSAEKLRPPGLDSSQGVASDIHIGAGRKKVRNVILTGINASGKSTFLRTLGINVAFLAQNLGIASAETFTLRPYTSINTLMEKNDELGRSSFETEVNQVSHLLKIVRGRTNKSRDLVLADELLRTTNPQEAAIGSYIIAEELGQLPHLTLLLSTHFGLLKKLAKKHPEMFDNKYMQTIDTVDGIPRPTFKLVNGVSHSVNTLPLLREMIEAEHPDLLEYMVED